MQQRERLPADAGDKLYRLAFVIALATKALGDRERAHEWLRRENRALGGITPLEAIGTEPGARQVGASWGAWSPLNGEGSLLFGSRWSRPGVAIASTSDSLALAALEYLVRVDPDLIPTDLVSIKVTVPDSIVPIALAASRLPPDWRDYPAPDALANIGDEWRQTSKSLLLRVPSVLIPEESNVLVNPSHPDFRRLKIAKPRSFGFDPRLIRRGDR